MFQNWERNKDNLAKAKGLSANKVGGTEDLKSHTIFEMMRLYLAKGEGENAVKKCQALYIFEILKVKGGPVIGRWLIDLKNGKGTVRVATEGDKVDSTFTMTDEDFE